MITIGIESSCDETAIAVLDGADTLFASEIASQTASHAKFGGIVPEIAARMHAEVINHIFEAAMERADIGLEHISLIAVTVGPGLAVSLVVGISFARALASVLKAPIIGVSHLEAHLMSNFISPLKPELPAVCLLVSGGHTDLILMRDFGKYEILGRTRDDAAGEAFDKAARLLNLGYPGGPVIQEASENRGENIVRLPSPMLGDGTFDFSFSGLKTAVVNYLKRSEKDGIKVDITAVAAGFQDAVVEVLVDKTVRAALLSHVKTVLLCGGVAANKPLRNALQTACGKHGLTFFSPPLEFCTDNAAMVAKAGFENYNRKLTNLSLSPQPDISI